MNTPEQNIVLKPYSLLGILTKVISFVFHPLFVPTYIFLFLRYQFPYEFAGISEWGLTLKTFSVFWMTAFFPAFAVFLLWVLKLGSKNMYLRTQKERIVPYMITMFFYWWMFYLSRNFTDQPAVLKFFFLGIFMATVVGLTVNNFMKISLHGMGVGGTLTAIILCSFYYQVNLGMTICIATIITGLVCTSRLLAKEHNNVEIYSGLFVGAGCQLLAYICMM